MNFARRIRITIGFGAAFTNKARHHLGNLLKAGLGNPESCCPLRWHGSSFVARVFVISGAGTTTSSTTRISASPESE
jgi:hypothetical protein